MKNASIMSSKLWTERGGKEKPIQCHTFQAGWKVRHMNGSVVARVDHHLVSKVPDVNQIAGSGVVIKG